MSGALQVWSVVSQKILDNVWCSAGVQVELTQDLRQCLVHCECGQWFHARP